MVEICDGNECMMNECFIYVVVVTLEKGFILKVLGDTLSKFS